MSKQNTYQIRFAGAMSRDRKALTEAAVFDLDAGSKSEAQEKAERLLRRDLGLYFSHGLTKIVVRPKVLRK